MPRRMPQPDDDPTRFDPASLAPYVSAAMDRDPDASGLADPPAAPVDAPVNHHNYRKIGLPALAAGSALDLYSTHKALTNGTGREANPLMGGMGPNALVGTNAAITALLALGLDALAKRNPRLDRAATASSLAIGGLRGGIGAHNLSIANGNRD